MRKITFTCIFLAMISNLYSQNLSFNKLPKEYQLFTRNIDNKATVEFSGQVNLTAIDSLVLTVSKSATPISREALKVDYSKTPVTFIFSPEIIADTVNYSFTLVSKKGTIETNELTVSKIVCGDAFIVSGQSNAACLVIGSFYTNQWIRTFGSGEADSDIKGDTTWGLAQAHLNQLHMSIGEWPMRMAKHIVENENIAVCVINGGMGGTPIEQQMSNNSNHEDLNTIYGRLNYRVNKAGIAGGARALLWHQGESNTAAVDDANWLISRTPKNYSSLFQTLYNTWEVDYPNLEKVYIFQIRPGCGGPMQSELREIQRTIPYDYDNVSIISTNGIIGHDGCHYSIAGYQDMGDKTYRFLDVDLYKGSYSDEIISPDIIKAYRSKDNGNRLILIFNHPIVWNETATIKNKEYHLSEQFFINGIKASFYPYYVDMDTVFLTLAEDVTPTTISYLPNLSYSGTNITYEGPWLMGANGLGVLSFYNYPIEQIASTPVDDYDKDSITISQLSNKIMKVHLNSNLAIEKYHIIDCNGRTRQTGRILGGNHTFQVNISQLEEGVFFIRFTGKNISKTKKFIN
jgi:hypothetical protein